MKERVLTAIIALLIFVPIVIFGGWFFQLIIYLLASLSLLELLKMRNISFLSWPSMISMLSLWIILYDSSMLQVPFLENFIKIEWFTLGLFLLLGYMVLKKNTFTFEAVGFMVTAIIYVGMGFYYFIVAREAGLEYLLYALVVIWATDTGAYFVGRSMGKIKLWPDISPKKTVEGSLGGVLLACIAAAIFQLIYPFTAYSIFQIILVTVIASIVGQIGDLVESAIKRRYDVKDSGKILPGHGGILDRFDSLIFMLPVLYFIGFFT
ncbi:phosphatidate cytidylyltransferase [Salinibacillus kushneri]|uniref:Phosphatidate cytidylyltransferase n=1 Tax=Salinibacillus kushneri TaxID=237682 RepID=A0A1I0E8F8_9BACI|nr:phosphatidate cytidylyltransferase [Salinibacillus kushneri]SET40743.1 phosphatidate cytidylyltransferase [Salinibacillus kushneri]